MRSRYTVIEFVYNDIVFMIITGMSLGHFLETD